MSDQEAKLQSIAGRDVLWLTSTNPEHAHLISEARNLGRPDGSFGGSTSVEIHAEFDGDLSISSTQWAADDTGSPWHKREFRTRSGHKLIKFNAELPSGDNIIYIKNGPTAGRCLIKCATQNALFTTGAGDGWSDDFIGRVRLDDKEFSLHAETYFDAPNLRGGGEWWIRMSVLSNKSYESPYLSECGAVGPNWSPIDARICKELPVSIGNPISTTQQLKSDGLIQNWDTSKCIDQILPDSIMITLSGELDDCNPLIMCRAYGGTFVTGFIWNNRGYRIIIEQINPIVIGKVSPTNPWSIMALNDDGQSGPSEFRCTMIEWNGQGCYGQPRDTKSVLIETTCNPFSGIGTWGNIGFKFNSINNVVTDVVSGENEHVKLSINKTSRTTSGSLLAGKYIVTISKCCVLIDGSATGHVRVSYNGKNGPTQRTFPKQPARSLNQAIQLYQGSTIKIDHVGGAISVDLVNKSTDIDGEIEVTFTAESLYSGDMQVNEVAVTDCSMHAKHIQLLQNRWSNSECIGLVAEVLGQEYIVIMTGDKIPCIGNGVAIAWPTLNNTSMAGVPSSGTVEFKVDDKLSTAVLSDISAGRYISSVGDVSLIKSVMFPAIR